MKVNELIDLLYSIEEENGDVEVKVAVQPAYPMSEVFTGSYSVKFENDEDEEVPTEVFLATVQPYNEPYVPQDVVDCLLTQGWSQ